MREPQIPQEIRVHSAEAATLGGLSTILAEIIKKNPKLSKASLFRVHQDHYDRVLQYGLVLVFSDETEEVGVSFDFDPDIPSNAYDTSEATH